MAAATAGGLIASGLRSIGEGDNLLTMETLLRYRGRAVTRDDVHQIRELVAAHPQQSRRALSQTLCAPGTGARRTARRARWCAGA